MSKLIELGQICGLRPDERHLDLACGKGEMLCLFARDHGTHALGIDIYPPFLAAARLRAKELGVEALVAFREGDASNPGELEPGFDFVSCIGATWIGGGLPGALDLMLRWAKPGAWILVGEVYWAEEPPSQVREAQEATQSFADLAGTLDRFGAAGLELVEMLLGNSDDWDRYQARQWMAASDWLAAHPEDPEADEVRRLTDEWRRSYEGLPLSPMTTGRSGFGFAAREGSTPGQPDACSGADASRDLVVSTARPTIGEAPAQRYGPVTPLSTRSGRRHPDVIRPLGYEARHGSAHGRVRVQHERKNRDRHGWSLRDRARHR